LRRGFERTFGERNSIQHQAGEKRRSKSFINNRILYGGRDKRDYDLGCLVKQVISYAKEQKKGIVFAGSLMGFVESVER
jgi:hypothetical protein